MEAIEEKIIGGLLDVRGFIIVDDLAEMIGLSNSSIKHNICNVKDWLKKFNITLLSVPKKGICLEATKEQRQEIFNYISKSNSSDSFEYRKNYILNVLFQYKFNYTIQLFAEELYVSRSVIAKDLKYIEKIFERHNLKLIRKRNCGIVIQGNEINIRQVILENNLDELIKYSNQGDDDKFDLRIRRNKIEYLTDMYKGIDFISLQDALLEAEDILNITLPDTAFFHLLEYIAITLIRISNGNFISENLKISNWKVPKECYEVASRLIDKLVNNKYEELDLEKENLATRLFLFSERNLNITDFSEVVKEFLNKLGGIISNEIIPKNDLLVKDINTQLNKIKIRDDYGIVIWDDINQDIKDQLSSLYGICLTILFETEELLGINFTTDDVAKIVLLIDNFINNEMKNYQVTLVTASDEIVSKYIANRLINKISGLEVYRNINYRELNDENISDDEIIISTVPLGRVDVVYIKKEIDKDDIKKVRDELEHKRTSCIKNNEFYEELIVCDLQAKCREDAIESVYQLLYKNDYVEEGFISRIWERENIKPTSIGGEIAIPHVYKDYVKKTGIAVAKLKYPVTWSDGEKVSIIFMMAINITSREKLKNLLKKLYGFIDDEGRRVKLISCESEKEMLGVLLK